MKSVLISVQPKWCELIARGIKTVEVRKSKPKLQTPFKCYIYATRGEYVDCFKSAPKDPLFLIKRDGEDSTVMQSIAKEIIRSSTWQLCNGTVIGEFVCDRIEKIYPYSINTFNDRGCEETVKLSCLTDEELANYAKGDPLYFWHISDLKIYDKPKELGEFFTFCNKTGNDECGDCLYLRVARSSYPCDDDIDTWCGVDNKKPITRPPQSWCYVEEL